MVHGIFVVNEPIMSDIFFSLLFSKAFIFSIH